MKASTQNLKSILLFSYKDLLITLLWIILHSAVGAICSHLTLGYAFGPIIYIHCTFLVALTTRGYLFGLLSAVITVFLSNFLFSFPRLTLTTAPDDSLSYLVMLIVGISASIITSTYQQLRDARRWNTINRLCNKLIRSASHDLRTPLTSISGATSALLDEENILSDDAKKNLLTACKDEADNLIRTMENLVLSTKVISGSYSLSITDEIVDEVLSEVIGRHCSNPDNPEILASIPQEILIAPMDVTLIKQALTNLLAVITKKSTPSSSINISLLREGKQAKIVFKYQGEKIPCTNANLLLGIGMSEKHLDLKSTCLELSFVASIIRLHNGTLTLSNKENTSELILRIPVV